MTSLLVFDSLNISVIYDLSAIFELQTQDIFAAKLTLRKGCPIFQKSKEKLTQAILS